MSSAILPICSAIYLVVILVAWIRTRSTKGFLLQLLPLVIMLGVGLGISTAKNGFLSFGPDELRGILVLKMFGAIVLGIGARYIFFLEDKFSWLEFIKPLCISPLLLLPLIGSIQTATGLDTMQEISFALLAFQNGFFWQAVLQKSRRKK